MRSTKNERRNPANFIIGTYTPSYSRHSFWFLWIADTLFFLSAFIAAFLFAGVSSAFICWCIPPWVWPIVPTWLAIRVILLYVVMLGGFTAFVTRRY